MRFQTTPAPRRTPRSEDVALLVADLHFAADAEPVVKTCEGLDRNDVLDVEVVVHQHGDLQVGGAEAHAVDLAAAAREGKPGFEVEGQFVAKQDLIGHGDVERGPRVGADGRTSGRNRVARQVQSGADAQDVLLIPLRPDGSRRQQDEQDECVSFHGGR